jgi:hypothetical protein
MKNRYKNIMTVIAVMIIICLITSMITYIICFEYLFRCNACTETFDGRTGVYYANEYYCVYVKDRPLDALIKADPNLYRINEISSTAIHEALHHMVYMDREHFCGK